MSFIRAATRSHNLQITQNTTWSIAEQKANDDGTLIPILLLTGACLGSCFIGWFVYSMCIEFNAQPNTAIYTDYTWYWQKQYRKIHKLNITQQTTHSKTILVQSPLTTLGQETRWTYILCIAPEPTLDVGSSQRTHNLAMMDHPAKCRSFAWNVWSDDTRLKNVGRWRPLEWAFQLIACPMPMFAYC